MIELYAYELDVSGRDLAGGIGVACKDRFHQCAVLSAHFFLDENIGFMTDQRQPHVLVEDAVHRLHQRGIDLVVRCIGDRLVKQQIGLHLLTGVVAAKCEIDRSFGRLQPFAIGGIVAFRSELRGRSFQHVTEFDQIALQIRIVANQMCPDIGGELLIGVIDEGADAVASLQHASGDQHADAFANDRARDVPARCEFALGRYFFAGAKIAFLDRSVQPVRDPFRSAALGFALHVRFVRTVVRPV